MRIAWVAAALLLVGCSTAANRPDPAVSPLAGPTTPCSDPRPEMCTMEYAPVCGIRALGGSKTYPSGCQACADSSVSGFKNGPCEE
ncbi:MAG: hypothetical protein AAGF57_07010 [Pseudomonadota bacterium]